MTHHLSSLSPTQLAVVRTVYRYGQITASQIRRLHYVGTPRGTAVRASRHLKALSERGYIRRVPHKTSTWERGSAEFVYSAPNSKAQGPNLHTIDIVELMVRLVESGADPLIYEPEPWSHDVWGGYALKPDAYVTVGRRHFFIEVDRGTEFASALSGQMTKYVNAYNGMDGGSFPQVIFLAHDADRVRFIKREADKKRVAGLFAIRLFDEGVKVMTNGVLP